MFWILIFGVCTILFYWFFIKPCNYWKERGVKQTTPLPILGDNLSTVLQTKSFAEMIQYVYNLHPNSRYMGMYQMTRPALVIRDPELIKQITVKDFDHFVNHLSFVQEDGDPLWAKNLVSLKDQKWHEMRSTLSPAFTSSKMRQMFVLMTEIAQQFVDHFLKNNENLITVEFKDTFTRFTNDVIASTAFGIKCDSLEERNNEFYLMGKDATNFSGFWRNLKIFGYFACPKLYKLLNIQLFSEAVSSFFKNLIKQNIKQREEHGIRRPDMIQLLLDARKNGLKDEEVVNNDSESFAAVEEADIIKSTVGNKREITDMDITSQALVFFFAGFDAVSNIMCFMGYELGVNPDIQERLRREVDEVADNCNDQLTYEALMKMKYMDMVLSETLRKWPNAASTDRVCTKPFVIEPIKPDEKPLALNAGSLIFLPIFGIHRDPKYYPNPDRFDPERFNDENKHKINPYTYIPFGAGPRNCIASRFALLETKVLIFYILQNFEIVPVEKTEIPLRISRKSFNMTAENGFWFGFKRRVK